MAKVFVSPLVSYVLLDDALVASAGDRGDVVAVGPELTAPEFFFDRGYEFEYVTACLGFDESDHLSATVFWKEPAEHVDMVLVKSDLMDIDRVTFFEPPQGLEHELLYRLIKQ